MYSFLSPGTVLQGHYRILRVLGGGGMGAVYLAEDSRRPGFHVAVKEMRTESEASGDVASPEAQAERQQAIASFEREADILKPLTHPNLPSFGESFEANGRPYVVMEFVPGESFEKKLERLDGKPMSEREAVYYRIQVARVLRYLHSQTPPIIFRDVKPANIMVMPNYQVKLIDFGIARKYKAGQRKDTVSMGTAAYAPFEQFGKGQTDGRSDIYSLAATLFHALTGRPPTPATTPNGLRDLNAAVTPATEQLIVRAMDRDMGKRPQSAREMEQELRQCYGIPFKEPDPMPGALAAAGAAAPPPRPAVVVSPPAATPAASAPPPPVAQPAAPRPILDPPLGAGAAIPPAPAVPRAVEPAAAPAGMVCRHCGHPNKGGARFCGKCGSTLLGRPVARLQVLGPRGVLWERRIGLDENPFVIGRRSVSRQIFPHLDLTYSDPTAYVSRRHVQILADDEGYRLEDLGSENGTFLNDARVPAHQPILLHPGDRIQVGKVQMQLSVG